MSSRKKRAKAQPKKHIIPFTLIVVIAVIIGVFGIGASAAYGIFKTWTSDLPGIDDIQNYAQEQKTRIWAADGYTLMAEFYEYDRRSVTSDQVSPYVFQATVSVEDERFYQHDGVDYYGIIRAFVVDLTSSRVEGASTITQQLVRQTVLQGEATDTTYKRKVREAALALEVEKKYSKDDILMMYLNTINYGDGCWGIESAAQHYFSKPASDLTIVEAALLCGIPQSPEYNNPVTYPDNALARRNVVLDRLCSNGYISEADLETAKATGLNLVLSTRKIDGIYLAPFASSYVRHELLANFPQDMIFKGGLDVYTSFDMQYQEWAEEACKAEEAQLTDG
ncbi:MAG: penicillin-binding protein, partial [Coriobacteriales bacterium]|nr:penicillin-binding protein [Coriobacteriales bacterium]